MDLETRLVDLDNSLSAYGPNDSIPWQVAQIYNVLLEEAKQASGDDPVLAVLEPLPQSGASTFAIGQIGTVRTAIAQILIAVR